ncbi:MAG: DUF4279 domain-containing protein [Edaphobacter sp.]
MAEISVALFIESETHSLEDLIAMIGVECNKSWRKGDARGRTDKVYATDSWAMAAKLRVPENIDEIETGIKDAVKEVLVRMRGREDQFRRAIAWGVSGLRISIVSPLLPPCILEAEALNTISKLGVGLEIEVAPQ